MVDHHTLRAASESDSYVVRKVLVEARAVACNDARLLCADALPALTAAVGPAVCGTLPRAQWRESIARALDTAVPDDAPPPPAVHGIGGLLQVLDAAVPTDAHERRVVQVLDSAELSRIEDARVRAPILLQLLRGAVAAGRAHGSLTSLQARIVASIAALSQPPLGLSGLVQAPLLSALRDASVRGASDTEASSAPPEAAARALFLAAAALARRGDQRGSKHGCVLVVEVGEEEEVGFGGVGFDETEETSGAACEACACDATDGSAPASPMATDAGRSAAAADAAVGAAAGAAVGSPRRPVRFALGDGRWAHVLGSGFNHSVVERRGTRGRTRIVHAECHAIADAFARHGEARARRWLRRASAVVVELVDDCGYADAPPCPKCACLLRAVGVAAARHSTCEGALRELRLPAARAELLEVGMACKPLGYALDEVGVRSEWLEHALGEHAGRERRAKEEADRHLLCSAQSKARALAHWRRHTRAVTHRRG